MIVVRSLGVVFCLALQMLSAHADSVQGTLEYQERFEKIYGNFVFPPPEKLFDHAVELSKFYARVKRGECGAALIQLALKFHVKYPNLPDPTDFKSGGYGAWHYIITPRDYSELLFCKALQRLARLDQEIKDEKISGTLRFGQLKKTV